MAFDPAKPVEYTELDAAEMRAQFNGLKELIDAQQAQITALQTQLDGKTGPQEVQAIVAANAARNVDGVGQLPPPWDVNSPSREEFDEVRTKVNDLIAGLGHPA